jgi:hypothetical protein
MREALRPLISLWIDTLDRSFLAGSQNEGDPCATFLKVENQVRWISLGEESLLALQFNHSSAKSGACQECCEVEWANILHLWKQVW